MHRTCSLALVFAFSLVLVRPHSVRAAPPGPVDPFPSLDSIDPDSPQRPDVWNSLTTPWNREADDPLALELLPRDGPRRKVSNKADWPFASLTTQVILVEPEATQVLPVPREAWHAEESWKCSMIGP